VVLIPYTACGQTLAEKDVKFFGPSLADRIQVSKTPTGSVKSLVFCDIESLYWEAARQAGMRGVRAPTHDPTSMSPGEHRACSTRHNNIA
jgi:hypothetical protein